MVDVVGSGALLLQLTTNLLHSAVIHNLPETAWSGRGLRRAPGSVEPIGPTSAAMEALDHFVDEQVKGSFSWYRPVHEFSEDLAGAVIVDLIEFEAPSGPLSRLMEKLVLARYLRNLIETRNKFLIADPVPGR